jgi:hypothetical protein
MYQFCAGYSPTRTTPATSPRRPSSGFTAPARAKNLSTDSAPGSSPLLPMRRAANSAGARAIRTCPSTPNQRPSSKPSATPCRHRPGTSPVCVCRAMTPPEDLHFATLRCGPPFAGRRVFACSRDPWTARPCGSHPRPARVADSALLSLQPLAAKSCEGPQNTPPWLGPPRCQTPAVSSPALHTASLRDTPEACDAPFRYVALRPRDRRETGGNPWLASTGGALAACQ